MIKQINKDLENIFPKNIPIVFLHAHPDDESFLNAGLIHNLTKDHLCRVIFTCAGAIKSQEKTRIRQLEALDSCKLVGVRDPIFLPFSDSKYKDIIGVQTFAEQDVDYVSSYIIDILDENHIKSPIILISYDKNGGYGHQDHVKLHQVGRKLKDILNDQVVLMESTINQNKIKQWIKTNKETLPKSQFPKLVYWSPIFGLPEKDISYYFKLTSTDLNIKMKSLMSHKSQISMDEFPLTLNKKDFRVLFGEEYFHLVKTLSKH